MGVKFRLVIWGTGGHAGSIIGYNSEWLENLEIVCFVDNSHRIGAEEFFMDKPILAPDELKKISYDGILILSTYIEEIRKQLTEDMKISPEYIVTLEELARYMDEQSGCSIIGKRVLIYGKDYKSYNYIYHLKQRTSSVRLLTENNEEGHYLRKIAFADLSKESYDYILLLDKNIQKDSFVAEKSERHDVDIDIAKILEKREWLVSLAFEYQIMNNESNKCFYAVIPRPQHGLMALFNEYLRMFADAYDRGFIPFVDMQNTLNMYLANEKFGKENAWEYYFEQNETKGYNINNIYNQENVIIPSMFIKSSRFRNISGNRITREKLRIIFNRAFSIKKEVKEHIFQASAALLNDVDTEKLLGIVYRGTDYISIQPANHMIQPDIDEFIDICIEKQQEWNCRWLYIATEDADALEKFKKVFENNLLYTNQIRYKNTGDRFLAQIHNNRKDDEYWRGYEYLEALLILTQCSYLVAGQNNGVDGSMILKNSEFKDMYIFDKGKYAVTNAKYL